MRQQTKQVPTSCQDATSKPELAAVADLKAQIVQRLHKAAGPPPQLLLHLAGGGGAAVQAAHRAHALLSIFFF